MFLVDSVPNAHLSRLISGGNVKTRWRVLGHHDVGGMLSVDIGILWRVKVPDYNRMTMTVDELLPIRRGIHGKRGAPLSPG